MIDQLPTFNQLLKTLQQVPYLSSKNLYKVADFFLRADAKKIEQFCAVLLMTQERVKPCPVCFCWYEVHAQCHLCADQKRDQKTVCVVETWQEMLVIEKTKGFTGVYHVLGGVISPIDGVGPDDLSIDALVARVKEKGITELILATNQTPEGEATAAYIAKLVQETGVKVSCLARGLPVGSSIEIMDRLTVFKALAERRPF
ncbi:recombination protein RecR [bacterium]|nr:MAG: recombination protein RecR [bacterium]QQR61995.1 MAG: recombination protein RecR [bacterium]QQR62412.1 MAG: recombination protein RecR [bacterium]